MSKKTFPHESFREHQVVSPQCAKCGEVLRDGDDISPLYDSIEEAKERITDHDWTLNGDHALCTDCEGSDPKDIEFTFISFEFETAIAVHCAVCDYRLNDSDHDTLYQGREEAVATIWSEGWERARDHAFCHDHAGIAEGINGLQKRTQVFEPCAVCLQPDACSDYAICENKQGYAQDDIIL